MATPIRSKQEKIAGYEARIARAEKWIKWYASVDMPNSVQTWKDTKAKLQRFIAEANAEA